MIGTFQVNDAARRPEITVSADGRGLVSHDARDLGRPEGSPALLSHRISFTNTGIPVIDDHALLPADSVVITVNRSAEHLEVHYTLAG